MRILEFDSDSFGEVVRELRQDKNWTQTELSKNLRHISASSVKNYEQGVALPSLQGLMAIAHALDIDEIRIDCRKGGRKWN